MIQPRQNKRYCLFYVKCGMLALVVLLMVLPVLGFAYGTIMSASDAQKYPPSGQMISVNGYQLHIHCMGEGNPTVILDAGGGLTSSSWAWIQPEIARITQVCVYDRAGWGWSDPSPHGYSAVQNANELHRLLINAGISGPYILAGHSLGGLYTRIYAQQFPDEVIGLVQIDASYPDSWQRLGLREGASADPNMLKMGAIVAPFGVLRLMEFVPVDADLPERQQMEMRAFFASTKFANAALELDRAFPEILEQARGFMDFGDIPLVVLTTGEVDAGATEDNAILRSMQLELLTLSSNSLYLVVEGANHVSLVHNRYYAQTTIDAIRRVVEAVQTGKPITR